MPAVKAIRKPEGQPKASTIGQGPFAEFGVGMEWFGGNEIYVTHRKGKKSKVSIFPITFDDAVVRAGQAAKIAPHVAQFYRAIAEGLLDEDEFKNGTLFAPDSAA